ncbi:MAG: phage head closure protein [Bacillota bacterium]|nr:phage head closure protein [Bacillota bacterium]
MLSRRDRKRIANRTYNNYIEIWDPQHTTENVIGQEAQTPKKLFDLRANIKTTRGKQYLEAQKVVGELLHTVTIHYRPGIFKDMKVKWKDGQQSRWLSINAVIDIENNRERLELMCTEQVIIDDRTEDSGVGGISTEAQND